MQFKKSNTLKLSQYYSKTLTISKTLLKLSFKFFKLFRMEFHWLAVIWEAIWYGRRFIATAMNFVCVCARNSTFDAKFQLDIMCDVCSFVHCYICYRFVFSQVFLILNPVQDTGLVGSHLRKPHSVAMCMCVCGVYFIIVCLTARTIFLSSSPSFDALIKKKTNIACTEYIKKTFAFIQTT